MRFRRLLLLLPLLPVLLAAARKAGGSSEELVQRGNAAIRAGAFDAAEQHLTDAEDTAADPGLVAFNKAVALFHLGRHADAERHFTRALDDADAPPARRAAALYDRGVCQLHQGGLHKFRGAIDSFRRCLDADPDAALRDDARHNLEVAKVLWVAARLKEVKPPPNTSPPDPPPEPTKKPPPEEKYDPFAQAEPTDKGTKTPGGKAEAVKPGTKTDHAQTTDEKIPGKGAATVLEGGERLPEMSDDQLRDYLQRLAARVAKDRRDTAALTAPPERPAVKDW